MLDQTMIDRYLEDVDSYLHVDRAHRERVLAEIEGHLHDAVEAHVNQGVEPQEAMQRAMAELGPPQDVAVQFSTTPPPARSVRGWRRWTPTVVPIVVLVYGVAFTVWDLTYLLQEGPTLGGRIGLMYGLLYTAVGGGLTAATFVAIRNGDRDPAWRHAAWVFAALTGIVVFLSYAL